MYNQTGKERYRQRPEKSTKRRKPREIKLPKSSYRPYWPQSASETTRVGSILVSQIESPNHTIGRKEEGGGSRKSDNKNTRVRLDYWWVRSVKFLKEWWGQEIAGATEGRMGEQCGCHGLSPRERRGSPQTLRSRPEKDMKTNWVHPQKIRVTGEGECLEEVNTGHIHTREIARQREVSIM